MKRNFLTLICLMCCIIVIGSCKKDLNDIHHNFKCKLYGSDWYPQENDLKLREAEAHLTLDGKQLFVKAHNSKSREGIGFLVWDKDADIKIGKYTLNSNNTYVGYYDKKDFNGQYYTGRDYQGGVEIVALDKSAKKVKGYFYFKCFNATTNQSAEITEGEFNLEYYEF